MPTEFLFSKIMCLNTAKLTSGESVYTSFGKPRKWTASERFRILSDENLHKFKLTIIVTTGLIDIQRSVFTRNFLLMARELLAMDRGGEALSHCS